MDENNQGTHYFNGYISILEDFIYLFSKKLIY
jgi:hypothetical protein